MILEWIEIGFLITAFLWLISIERRLKLQQAAWAMLVAARVRRPTP